jgi:hypothetical protein
MVFFWSRVRGIQVEDGHLASCDCFSNDAAIPRPTLILVEDARKTCFEVLE